MRVELIKDAECPGLYRIKWSDGVISDRINRQRADEVAYAYNVSGVGKRQASRKKAAAGNGSAERRTRRPAKA